MPDYPTLPKFEGRVPDTASVSFTGGQEGQPPHIDAYRHGMAVAFLVIGEVGDVTHGEKGGENDRRYVRGHKVVVEKLVYLDPDEAGRVYNNEMERLASANPAQDSLDDLAVAIGEGNTATLTSSVSDASVVIQGKAADEGEVEF